MEAKEHLRRLEEQSTKLESEVGMLKGEIKRSSETRLEEAERLRSEHTRAMEEVTQKYTWKLNEAMKKSSDKEREVENLKDDIHQKNSLCSNLKRDHVELENRLRNTEEKLHLYCYFTQTRH